MDASNLLTIKSITGWFIANGIGIAIVLAITIIIKAVVSRIITSAVRHTIKRGKYSSTEAEHKREGTIIRILNGTFSVFIWSIASMMMLTGLGVQIGPILAAAGIVGVALGFGSQYLIKDIIAGLFIIVENQFQVGDVVTMNGTSGLVEDITLRLTTLRDLDGVVHHIQNGSVTMTSNMTKDLSRVNLNMNISYKADLEKVIKVIDKVGEDMAKDDAWEKDIIHPPKFLRVDDFSDSAIVVKILGETQPARQWDVTGELRKRLKIAFDKNNIEIPLPQRVMHTNKD